MAFTLDWFDGFDHYTAGQAPRFYDSGSSVNTMSSGRFGGQCARITNSSLLTKTLTSKQSWVMAFALYRQDAIAARICRFLDSTTSQVELHVILSGSDYLLQAKRGDGTVLGTGSTPVTHPQWHWIEFGVKIDNSNGEIVAKLNGVTQFSLTGIDTQNSANATADKAEVGANTSFAIFHDDWAVWGDSAGGSPSGALPGELRVKTQAMTADEVAAWTKSGGSANYQNIDETTANDDTDYNYSSTSGQEDRFQPATITVTGNVKGVAVFGQFRKDDAGTRTVKLALKSGATVYYGANVDLFSTYSGIARLWELDPNTGVAWTESGINASRPGYNLVA